MRERGVKRSVVMSTLREPDELTVDRTNPDRFLAKKVTTLDSKPFVIIVVFEKNLKILTVITIVATSKILKYLTSFKI